MAELERQDTSSVLMNFLSDPATLVALGLVAAGTAYYLATRPSPARPPVPLDNQSLELPGGERARASQLIKKNNNELLSYLFEDAKTVYECFQRGKAVSNNGPCLGWRPAAKAPYQWITYGQVEERVTAFGAGLAALGVEPGQESFVGVYGHNTVEWVVVEQSCNYYSRVLVPLYDTLGPEAVAYIVNQTVITVVVCHATKVQLLLDQAENCPSLRLIVKMGGQVTEEEKEQATKTGLTVTTFEEVEKRGRDTPVELVLPSPDDLCTICYTSGTTGNPKGVMLTHGNLVADVAGIYQQMETAFKFHTSDVYISYLPLAHMYERISQVTMFMNGCQIGFYRGNVKELLDDVKELRPTLFASVPRLLNRIYDKVLSGASASPVKKWLFDRAMASKLAEVRRGIIRRDSLWDWLVFGKIQNLLGGRVRFVVTGSAPISSDVLDFLRVALGCQLLEGYGQTEGTTVSSMIFPGDVTPGHVGPPLACNYIKLVDVPDMNYFADNAEGEVCFKGPSVFKGYYKDPEKTAETLDEDGWLHSGDIGCWLPNGTLKIIDRKKHIFKLSQGEYIAPEKIENIYVRAKLVAQTYIYGDSLKSCLVAIVCPDEEEVMKWAKKNNVSGTFQDICLGDDLRAAILSDLTKVGKDSGLHSFEQAKAIMLFAEGFTVENGLLTPTFKLKRPAMKAKFMPNFVQLYSTLPS